ncbi:MAG: hypothetical protein U9R57_12165 [Thermodesulfobacteriota bacterium]|nr:hypothetical protein [Thermodesulfobacteriota bacterium]
MKKLSDRLVDLQAAFDELAAWKKTDRAFSGAVCSVDNPVQPETIQFTG